MLIVETGRLGIIQTGNEVTVDLSPPPRMPRSAPAATAVMQGMRSESPDERVAATIPCEASPLALDIETELHLSFPPKSVRVVQGRVIRRGRAVFRSELLDQTLAE